MSRHRETHMNGGPSIIKVVDDFFRSISESARRREEERRQAEADRGRRRREQELAKQHKDLSGRQEQVKTMATRIANAMRPGHHAARPAGEQP